MKKAAIRYGISYIVMWGIVGIVILGKAPDANLTQAGLLRGIVALHAAVAVTAAMEVLATTAWNRLRDVRQRRRREDSNG